MGPPPRHVLRNRIDERLQSYRLTHREKQIVGLLLQGLSNKDIAFSCHIGEQTVKDHLKHAYRKIGVSTRAALMASLLQFPLVGEIPARKWS